MGVVLLLQNWQIKILGFMTVLCHHANLFFIYKKGSSKTREDPHHNFFNQKVNSFDILKWETVAFRIWLDYSNSRLASLKWAFREILHVLSNWHIVVMTASKLGFPGRQCLSTDRMKTCHTQLPSRPVFQCGLILQTLHLHNNMMLFCIHEM